jgi:EAL domain-containing protein (putative c-di-GMP-specific phosphodiesterase class I)
MAPAVITAGLLLDLAIAGVALGLTACAEGVQDVATWQALVGLGCDTVQGYAISRPMPAAEVPGWLERSLTPAPVA